MNYCSGVQKRTETTMLKDLSSQSLNVIYNITKPNLCRNLRLTEERTTHFTKILMPTMSVAQYLLPHEVHAYI
jgi:hypothetical protein